MTELPKQDMLRKLLKMTASPNDGEALVAVRKANELLRSAGWDWDKLLDGKIRIAADPFANLGNPHNPAAATQQAPPPPPPRPAPPPPPRPPQPPPPPPPPRQPAPPPRPFEPWSHRSTNGQSNIYPGNCYCCGVAMDAKDGKLFVPTDFNKHASVGKKPICLKCDADRHAFIDNRPAAKKGKPSFNVPPPTAGDL
jgi:hypothetical protein